MMNISPIVNSVKCTVFSRFVQFSHDLEGTQGIATQETTAMLFAYTNATLLLKWSKERSDV